jgi:hypothetical protein
MQDEPAQDPFLEQLLIIEYLQLNQKSQPEFV